MIFVGKTVMDYCNITFIIVFWQLIRFPFVISFLLIHSSFSFCVIRFCQPLCVEYGGVVQNLPVNPTHSTSEFFILFLILSFHFICERIESAYICFNCEFTLRTTATFSSLVPPSGISIVFFLPFIFSWSVYNFTTSQRSLMKMNWIWTCLKYTWNAK